MELPFLSEFPGDPETLQASYGLVVDALFGFSFTPPVRPAFAGVLDTLRRVTVPVCSVDVLSGKQTYTHTNKQRVIQTNTQTERQTGRQICK